MRTATEIHQKSSHILINGWLIAGIVAVAGVIVGLIVRLPAGIPVLVNGLRRFDRV
jgi:hypothetical protein